MDEQYEGVLPELYTALAGVRNQNRYRKLHPDTDSKLHHDNKGRRRILKSVKLGSVKGVWRLRISKPTVRLLLKSPVLALERVRDAYVKMMVSFATKGRTSGAMFGGAMYTGKGNLGGQNFDTRDENFVKEYIIAQMIQIPQEDMRKSIAEMKQNADETAEIELAGIGSELFKDWMTPL